MAAGLSDEQLADAVRQDRIDILVDLTMHMARNRLLVFARKPAPVQVTYLAYCGTTGLDTMDYRLTDPYLDPPGPAIGSTREQSVRLPETYWCYRPLADARRSDRLPAVAGGPRHLRLLEQLLQGDRPTLAAWCRPAAGGAGRRGCCCTPGPAVTATACGHCWPSKAFRPSGSRSSTWCRTWNTCDSTSRSTWPWTRSPTAAAPRPATPCGWACRW